MDESMETSSNVGSGSHLGTDSDVDPNSSPLPNTRARRQRPEVTEVRMPYLALQNLTSLFIFSPPNVAATLPSPEAAEPAAEVAAVLVPPPP